MESRNEEPAHLVCRTDLNRRAKIVATIGPSSNTIERIREMIAAGLDVARLNMSHGSHEDHAKAVERLRAVSEELHKPIAILLDLCGPKIRTGKLKGGGPVELAAGGLITITPDEIEGDASRISASYPYLTEDLRIGDRMLLDDGSLELAVERKEGRDLVCRIIDGGSLGERKGINLPGVSLSIPSITEKDKRDLEFGIRQRVDYIALSFVRAAQDCRDAKALIEQAAANAGGFQPPLIAKIEKGEALKQLDEILDAADGIMVARGDLGIETAAESVPIHQKEMIRKAIVHGKVVITATQMLQSMIVNPRPTRAEASDVANAVLDGTDAVMLSGETASGAFPVLAIKTMDRIARVTEEAVYKQIVRPEIGLSDMFSSNKGSYGRALAEAAVFAAKEVESPIILVFTQSGMMAQHVAALRPRQDIIAFTPSLETSRRLAAVWGTRSYLLEQAEFSDELLALGDRMIMDLNLVEPGETIVMLAGRISGIPLSDMVKLHRVGELNRED